MPKAKRLVALGTCVSGELIIVSSHWTKIGTYKTLHPGVRVVILKALCDIRVEQDDIISYIDDSIIAPLSTFCKHFVKNIQALILMVFLSGMKTILLLVKGCTVKL